MRPEMVWLDSRNVVCWARSQDGGRSSRLHAWRKRPDGRLDTFCGTHSGTQPAGRMVTEVRRRRACGLCLRSPYSKSSTRPEEPRATDADHLFNRAQKLSGPSETLAAIAQAMQDHRPDDLAVAIGNQAVAVCSKARSLGIQADRAFLDLAGRQEWLGTLDEALALAAGHAAESSSRPSKPSNLFKALARSCRTLDRRVPRGRAIEHVGMQVYFLVALASLHNLNAVECIRKAIRRLEDPNPSQPT